MMKARYILVIALFMLLALPCLAQYNEKQIMQQQAYQLMAQRQYAQAEQLFARAGGPVGEFGKHGFRV